MTSRSDDDFHNLFTWVQDVTVDQLPSPPIVINEYTKIVNPERWLSKLQQDARLGAEAPRAYYGALQADLRFLYTLITERKAS